VVFNALHETEPRNRELTVGNLSEVTRNRARAGKEREENWKALGSVDEGRLFLCSVVYSILCYRLLYGDRVILGTELDMLRSGVRVYWILLFLVY
jgi:hypothetical protein